jgi:transposase-like protein
MDDLTRCIRKQGFCCPWAYFYSNRKRRTLDITAELGVDWSTVRRWRREFRAGKHLCRTRGAKCLLILPPPPPPARKTR